jgi:hypothetical protein
LKRKETAMYKIKPLVWKDVGTFSSTGAMGAVLVVTEDNWWSCGNSMRPCSSIEEGKRLAEEYWQSLLLEHLEEVKE